MTTPSGIRRLISRLTNVGVDPALPRRDTKHVVLTNGYALFGLFVYLYALAWSPVSCLRHDVRVALAAGAVAALAAIGLNAVRRHVLAGVVLQVSMIATFTYIGVREPIDTEHIALMFTAAAVGFSLLPRSHRALATVMALVALAAAISIRMALHATPDPEQLAGYDSYVVGVSNIVLGIITLIWFSSQAATEIDRVEDELVEERKKTETLLKREVAHQVAERSRELGSALARGGDTTPALSGARFGSRYKVIRPLGEGGMGTVVEVERASDGERLALKVMSGSLSREQSVRFAREAEIGARIHHEHLVAIVDVGLAENGAPYLVMELAKGGSLEGQRARFGDVPWALSILRQIASGLVALHDAGVVHRDLKPANVLLDEAGSAKLSDSGSRASARSRWAAWTRPHPPRPQPAPAR